LTQNLLSFRRKVSLRKRLFEKASKIFIDNWQLYLLIMPALIYIIIFNYLPLYGVQIAFKNYKPVEGILGSSWVGLLHFKTFFKAFYSQRLIVNTFLLNLYGLIFGFPLPIILAIIINNLGNDRFKRFTQTVVYIPHFISTVVLAGMVYIFLSPTNGIINHIITAMGGEAIFFLNEPNWFRRVYIISGIWQAMGWSSILYIATLAGVNQELYEAATVDGASKFQKVIHIDIPHIIPTATMMLILSCGTLLSSSAEKALLFQTGGNISKSDVIGTYVYTLGLGNGQFSYTAAIGLLINIINFIMISIANTSSKRLNGETLF
jgi:putative aldouronate transport system permease protein